MDEIKIGFAQANSSFGLPAENMHGPSFVQDSPDGCDFNAEARVLNDYGFHVSEAQLQEEAARQGWYEPGHGTPLEMMGSHLTNPSHYIPCNITEGNTHANLVVELSKGHRVIVPVDSGEIWNPGFSERMEDIMHGGCPDHAIIVDGLDESTGTVTVTDSGSGDYRCTIPLDRFDNAWADGNNTMVATAVSPEEFLSGIIENSD